MKITRAFGPLRRLSFGTWGGFEEEDLLGLSQHDEAQGAHGLGGDVHGGLPVQRWQHCVLDVAKRSAGQLDNERDKERNGWDTTAKIGNHITWYFCPSKTVLAV